MPLAQPVLNNKLVHENTIPAQRHVLKAYTGEPGGPANRY